MGGGRGSRDKFKKKKGGGGRSKVPKKACKIIFEEPLGSQTTRSGAGWRWEWVFLLLFVLCCFCLVFFFWRGVVVFIYFILFYFFFFWGGVGVQNEIKYRAGLNLIQLLLFQLFAKTIRISEDIRIGSSCFILFFWKGLFRCKVFLYRAYILGQSSLDEIKGI